MNENQPRTGSTGSDIREKVLDKASTLASGAKDGARAQYDQKKDTALNELENLASALRSVGEQSGGSMVSTAASAAASRIESFSRSLEGKQLDDIVGDVERFARRNPAAFVGTAVAIGFLASRFLKSSSSRTSGFNDYDAYSSEAYGGYTSRGMDTAIGTGGYATGNMFTPSATSGVNDPLGMTSASDSPITRSGLSTSGAGTTGLGASGDIATGGLGTTASDFDTPISGSEISGTKASATRTTGSTGTKSTTGNRGRGGSSTGDL
jgi:hypothetical protein